MRDPRLVGTMGLPPTKDAAKAGGSLAGRPEDIIEVLKAVEKRYPGLDRVICATPLGTPPEVRRFCSKKPFRIGHNPRLRRHPNRRRSAVASKVRCRVRRAVAERAPLEGDYVEADRASRVGLSSPAAQGDHPPQDQRAVRPLPWRI